MKKLLIAALTLLAFSCTKEKKKDTCTTDNRVVGTWAQDSIIQGGLKYKTPYYGIPNTVQTRIRISSTLWEALQYQNAATTTTNSFAIELACDKIKVGGDDGYSFELLNDTILHITAIPNGQQYFYHSIK